MLWRDPGNVRALDFRGGPGGRSGAPKPPFRLVSEEKGGTQPKAMVRDARGRLWSVKWGDEVRAEVFASRLVWACGYHTEPTYYVAQGRILGAKKLDIGSGYLKEDGRFREARFERRDPRYKFIEKYDWTWEKNPFTGTRQFNGLKILVMLLSNWDNKDGRNGEGSNTGILQNGRIWVYHVTDWGASMGKWGGFFRREKWDCEDYAEQTSEFIEAFDDGEVEWGFSGSHDGDFKEGIGRADIRWLIRYLGRVTDAQLAAGLRASGANAADTRCFTRSIRARINQLRRVSSR